MTGAEGAVELLTAVVCIAPAVPNPAGAHKAVGEVELLAPDTNGGWVDATEEGNAAEVETPPASIDELTALKAGVDVDFGLELVGAALVNVVVLAIDVFIEDDEAGAVFLTEVDAGTGRVRMADAHVVAADGGKTVE